ncbi:trypsin-like serine peptidase [Actinomadura atramentaria]|uniref:trypsin-like serine peptidase n=1 Tax=Actinomadura atramentaria TaxID=1990 RepID=UPI00036AA0BF|nr:hypothetical protein [Actinomadura atramentaria]
MVAVRAPSAADARRATGSWTPARMRAARPVPIPERRAAPGRPRGTAVHSVAPRPGPRAAVSASTGKVFFRDPANGRDYSCSAAVVRSASGDLVATAGHCVRNAAGWLEDWTFVPGYDRGRRPYGTWRAEWLAAFAGWVRGARPEYDAAFVKVAPRGGRDLAAVVGANGLRTGGPARARTTVLGYPFLAPYDGERQESCAGTTRPAGVRRALPCPLTTGASGGPWLSGYDGGTGYVTGVTTNTDLRNTTLWSPPFGDAVWRLYRSADAL